jgi:hypothetical protein
MTGFVEIVYFGPPEAERAYRRWYELNELALRNVPSDAVRVDTGRVLDGGIFVRVSVAEPHAKAFDD